MDEKILEQIGLTKGESIVYLTLLKIGETTTGKIIEQAQISSGKIYEILDRLIKKGLVSFTIKEKTKYFSASSPNRVLDYLKEKEQKIKEQEQEFKKQLPELLQIRKQTKEDHETKLFKGFKGIYTAIFEALEEINSKDEVLAMGIKGTKNKEYNILWENWHNQRIKRKIKARLLFSEDNSYYKTLSKLKLTKTKIIKGITPSAIDILGERVLIFTYGNEPSCLSIKNKEISESFKTFFENLWAR